MLSGAIVIAYPERQKSHQRHWRGANNLSNCCTLSSLVVLLLLSRQSDWLRPGQSGVRNPVGPIQPPRQWVPRLFPGGKAVGT